MSDTFFLFFFYFKFFNFVNIFILLSYELITGQSFNFPENGGGTDATNALIQKVLIEENLA